MISKPYQETSAVTNGFNHPSDNYKKKFSTDSSAQTKSPQNDGQNSGRESRGFRSWIYLQIFVPAPV